MDFPAENIKDRIKDFLEKENLRSTISIKIGVGLILLITCYFFFPHPESSEYRYYVGAVWTDRDLVSPFSFPIYKDLHRYEVEQEQAVLQVKPVFVRNDSNAQYTIEQSRNLFRMLDRASQLSRLFLKNKIAADSIALNEIIKNFPEQYSSSEWRTVFKFIETQKSNRKDISEGIFAVIEQKFTEIYKSGFIDKLKSKLNQSEIAVRKKSYEEIIPLAGIYDNESILSQMALIVNSAGGDELTSKLILKLIEKILKPNLIFSLEATNEAVQVAVDNVPRTLGYVPAHELIISKNEPISEEVKLKLDSYRRTRAEHGAFNSSWKHFISSFFHVTVIISLFTLYLFLFRKKIFQDNGKIVLIASIILMEVIFGYLSIHINIQEPLQYLIFVPVASMLLAIIFDTRVAFYGTVTIAFLIGSIRGNDYAIALSSIVAGALAAYTVRDIRSRTQIFWSMIYIFVGYVISIIALSIEYVDKPSQIITQTSFALANAVFSPLITYGLLLLFERIFRVTTDLRLAELADFNYPLLVELSEKAPGTFHHSVTIGNLAEAAAEAIDANSILAKVGGYYHDIGKMLKSEYFIENQVGPHSRHNRLKPRMSALIISAHVREGVELGRERGIPEVVLDFIPQHHGTTRISFFFDKALKQAAKRPTKDAVREEDFMYPGPKPQTKETGIVMLADSVEAATRTIHELTPQKLESAIDNMIKHRFMDGQLDECELTLRELTKIKEAFLKILLGIHHHRIKYPEQEIVESIPTEIPAAVAADSVESPNPVATPTISAEINRIMPDIEPSDQVVAPPSEIFSDENKKENNSQNIS
ncbi:MAG: HDIG domain-containing protein [Ignavibacteriales bacterium]|nr:HDIG domain-containing protein [Ignavibacteriales bacterium]